MPKFYECDICGHIHPWEWNGDCRDDANRHTIDQIEAKFGVYGFEVVSMDERIEADLDHNKAVGYIA